MRIPRAQADATFLTQANICREREYILKLHLVELGKKKTSWTPVLSEC